jgi:hypothetical protein
MYVVSRISIFSHTKFHTNPAPTVRVTSGTHMVQLHADDHYPAKRNGEVKLKPPWIVYGDWCLCSFGDFADFFFWSSLYQNLPSCMIKILLNVCK